ncbi:MAG: hypothetical protein O3A47_13580 [Chloroflexi bacterium]|nr:hypothetical protein [Chloroflexota bacterium]
MTMSSLTPRPPNQASLLGEPVQAAFFEEWCDLTAGTAPDPVQEYCDKLALRPLPGQERLL